MIGKTTLARSLASRLGWSCISTDDIGEILQTVIDINPMKGKHYTDFYMNTTSDALIDDIKEYHKKIKPAIQRLIEIHSTWGSPIIIEGWAIYPDIMEKIRSDSISAIWLITDESLLRKRLIDNANFYKNAVDPIAMRENYLSRSIWHNNFLLEQCKKKNQKFLLLSGRESLDELFARIEV